MSLLSDNLLSARRIDALDKSPDPQYFAKGCASLRAHEECFRAPEVKFSRFQTTDLRDNGSKLAMAAGSSSHTSNTVYSLVTRRRSFTRLVRFANLR